MTKLIDIGLEPDDFDLLLEENDAQLKEYGNQEHSLPKWMLILGEEVGEVHKAALEYLNGNGAKSDIEDELVSVSTLALKITTMVKGQLPERKE